MVFIVVCYDVPDDRRRTKLSKTLEGYGVRSQRSVFECDVTEQQLARLQERVRKLMKPPDDQVRYYPLCEACLRKVVIVGPGEVHRAPSYVIV